MKKYVIIFLVTIINFGCKSNLNKQNKIEIIEVSILDYGKIHLTNSQILDLSNISKINKKYFTTSLYCYNGNDKINIPINDKLFNHEYFRNHSYDSIKKVKLFITKYSLEDKIYSVAIKIE